MEAEKLKELVSYIVEKGFIWGPEPEIYGGTAGFYTYAPLGKLLKNNVEGAIRSVLQANDFWEVECPTVMKKEVWEASGHLGGFSDPMIQCSKCESIFRVDTLLEEQGIKPDNDLLKQVNDSKIKCPSCKGSFKNEIKKHSLMMRTTVGVDTEAYNRPETATTTYLPFQRFADFFRKKVPFGVFQIGKAYRNEISPRQHVMRCREFTQAEAQLFIEKSQKDSFEKYEKVKNEKLPFWPHQLQEKGKPKIMTLDEALKNKYLKNKAYAWCLFIAYKLFREIGIPEEKIRMRQHFPEEKAFYADDAWDLEINLNTFGWFECCGIHDRTDYDLKQHAKFSGKKLEMFSEDLKKNIVPHVLEIAFGTDRPVFALLDLFYEKKEKEDGKSLLKLPVKLAPVKVAIFPLMNKDELLSISNKVYDELSKNFVAVFDKSGAIGRRYLRQDEIGTPFCLTVDFDSVKGNDITLRERDSAKQKRVKIKDLSEILRKLINKEVKFEVI